MQQITLGGSDLQVSTIGLGCNNLGWTIDAAQSQLVVDEALERGITLFDTADMYGEVWGNSERTLGQSLAGRRNQVVIVTKFGRPEGGGPSNNSREFIVKAIEGSLKRLRTDWIDVYMIHWPDEVTPIEETLRALSDIVTSGKARYIACSNLSANKLQDYLALSRELGLHRFIVSQNPYSLLDRDPERDLIPILREHNMGLMPYFPLASGLLTGKYRKASADGRLRRNFLGLGDHFMTPANLRKIDALDNFARARGCTILDLAISWLLHQPTVSGVIAGATKPVQVVQNTAAAAWPLSDDDLAELAAITAQGDAARD